MNRRHFLAAGVGLAMFAAAPAEARFSFDEGLKNRCRRPLPKHLREHPLVAGLRNQFDSKSVWDCHVHLYGNGKSRRGIWLSPGFAEPISPIAMVRKSMFISGGCLGRDDAGADQRMIDELAVRVGELPKGAKAMLLAFDGAYDEDGTWNQASTTFKVPDAYAAAVAKARPEHFEWIASIHPYRADAVEALQWAKANGARAVKWLPPAMGIDLRHPKSLAFYDALVRLDVPLLTHAGEEKAVPGAERYELSNPLMLRAPLDAGVRVIAAHCASAGRSDDLDQPEKTRDTVPDFELWQRLMSERRYEGRLFGDISAISLISRAGALEPLLARDDWHHRLLNGSDYPLPGVMPLISTRKLGEAGLLAAKDVPVLIELREYNALLFDLALKAALRYQGKGFSASVFETRGFFCDPGRCAPAG
jgi:uncharacterized protein